MPLGGLLPYGDEQLDSEGYDMPVMLTDGDITDLQDQGPQGDMGGFPEEQNDILSVLRRKRSRSPEAQAGQIAQGGPLGGMAPGSTPDSMGAALLKGFRG